MDLTEYRSQILDNKKEKMSEIEGAIPQAVFCISPQKKVVFSKGNLQFKRTMAHDVADGVAKGIWRFSDLQYDFVGNANAKAGHSYRGWIDLFGWGTSGWQGRNPWWTSKEDKDYPDIVDHTKFDWGVYNAISKGGNEPNFWRMLTAEEMGYLMTYQGWTLAFVAEKLCLLLFPEAFKYNQYGITPRHDTSWNAKNNGKIEIANYSATQFVQLESQGVVALPCAGCRDGSTVDWVNSGGGIWLSSVNGSNQAELLWFCSEEAYIGFSNARYFGWSVRLVHEI